MFPSLSDTETQLVSRKPDRYDILLVACLLLAFGLMAVMPFAPHKYGDIDFHLDARTLTAAMRGSAPWSDVVITRAPGPVLYYLIPYLVITPGSNDNTFWLSSFVWTMFWMSLSLLLIRRAGTYLGGPRTGLIAAGLILLSPFSVYYSYGILAEPAAFVGISVFVFGWARWQQTGQAMTGWWPRMWTGWAGLALFLLSRPNAVLVAGLAALAGIWLWRRARRREAMLALAFVMFSVCVLGLSGFLLSLQRGEKRGMQRELLALVLVQGRYQFRTETWDWRYWHKSNRADSRDFQDWENKLIALDNQAREAGRYPPDLITEWVRQDALAHPWLTLKMAAVRLITINLTFVNSLRADNFRLGPLRGSWLYYLLHAIINATNLVTLLSAILYFPWRRDAALWPLWSVWLGLIVFHALVYAEPRYMFPTQPVLAIAAAMWWRSPGKPGEVSGLHQTSPDFTRLPETSPGFPRLLRTSSAMR
ncbi:MAG: hypothetical protein ACKV2V_26910 [Blastocatellia bacterium]